MDQEVRHQARPNPTKGNTTRYATRAGATTRDIVEHIEASEVVTSVLAEYDIDAIADELLIDYLDGYKRQVDAETFCDIVAKHDRG